MITLHTQSEPVLLPAGTLVAGALAYGLGAARLRRRGDRWPWVRDLTFGAGLIVLAGALGPLAARAHHFPGHVGQHLLISGVAPLLIALGAPVTLAVRASPPRARRRLLAVLHSRPVRVLTFPPVIVVLAVVPMGLLYLTDAYAITGGHALWHPLVHLHMVAAGYLSTSYLLGLDPLPRRVGVVERLLVLVVIAGSHHTLAKAMYALGRPAGGGSLAELQLGAQGMYYGGGVIELALAVIIMARWYAAGGRDLNRARQREGSRRARQRHQLDVEQLAAIKGQDPERPVRLPPLVSR